MIRLLILLIAIAAFCFGVFFLWRLLFAKNIPAEPSASITVGTHIYEVEIAQTLEQKAKGLAGRDSLADRHGMVFPFTKKSVLSFTMQGMRFPLDIIWIADGKIVDISQNLQPDTGMLASAYRPKAPADMVLELNAGVAAADGLKIGDSVTLSYKK